MNIFLESDYKEALRKRLSELRQRRPALTLQSIASQLPIQYTYLSKALKPGKTHLNEDHLFVMARLLELHPDEEEFLALLRARDLAQNADRRTRIEERIEKLRESHNLEVEPREFSQLHIEREIAYLLNPVCVLVHVALHLKPYFEDPRKLCAALGISDDELASALESLTQLGFVERDGKRRITKIVKRRMHYGKDHPLMRSHQNLLRALCSARLLRADESEKKSFMATFTADEVTATKIRQAFDDFVKKAERLTFSSTQRRVYQMNFDLFPWL